MAMEAGMAGQPSMGQGECPHLSLLQNLILVISLHRSLITADPTSEPEPHRDTFFPHAPRSKAHGIPADGSRSQQAICTWESDTGQIRGWALEPGSGG
jgi:hypothetical protein